MTREFLRPDDLRDLVTDQCGADRRLAGLDRLTGGSKKGVYRLRLDDRTTVILYVWADGENYWPPAPAVPDDPFTDASGADLFAAAHAALTAASVRTPRLLMIDRDGLHRLEFYRFAQVLSLIEGPLRIADTDFPDCSMSTRGCRCWHRACRCRCPFRNGWASRPRSSRVRGSSPPGCRACPPTSLPSPEARRRWPGF
jgi:hypothetical protein